MNDDGLQSNKVIVKSEPEDSLRFESLSTNHIDALLDHKNLSLSPLNDDFDNVDIESINIDDIFNDSHTQDNWCPLKDESDGSSKYKNDLLVQNVTLLSDVCNSAYTSSLSISNSCKEISLPQYSKVNYGAEENKLFLITDILSDDKVSLNNQFTTTNNPIGLITTQQKLDCSKPQLSLLLNQHSNFVDNSVIYNQRSYKTESLFSVSCNNYLNFQPNSNNSISKPKVILPIVGPSPKKKCFPLKSGKLISQLCCICNDNATGKHYGVISCEGCKGFFKRTVRNSLPYTCRDFNNCAVDKKFRNRCQACRFQKCLQVGMKREAVQIERPDKRSQKSLTDNSETVISSPSSVQTDESLEKMHYNVINQINSEHMLDIELQCNPDVEENGIIEENVMKVICQHVNEHLFSIVSWAKYLPGFTVLNISDQTLLIKLCWGELVVANFTHRSLKLNEDMILLRNGTKLARDIAQLSGIGKLIDRIFCELLHRFRDLKIDKCELSYIKAIILFNPNLKNLENRSFVQMIRDKLYSSLQQYCQQKFPSERFRFSKLLLRLPALRSIAHNCLDHFRFYDIIDKCRAEAANDKSDGDESELQFSFLDEMLGHSDLIMDH